MDELSILYSSEISDGHSALFIYESLIQPFFKKINYLKYMYPAAPLSYEAVSRGMLSSSGEAVFE